MVRNGGTRPVQPTQVIRVGPEGREEAPDLLAGEEPLEIRLKFGKALNRADKSISVTMRTPGHDMELAAGFLFTEGILQFPTQIENIRYCTELKDPAEEGNVLLVSLAQGVDVDMKRLERHFYTSSSCGVCGKASIEAVNSPNCQLIQKGVPQFQASLIHTLPDLARDAQSLFKHTGGIHAAALFDTSGELLLLREDIGRHNAVDKVIGAMFMQEQLPLSECMIMVSGRAGFELVQKSLTAGIPLLAAVGAPSSLAVDLAREYGMSLLGFVRGERFNIYSGAERVAD